MLVLLRIVVQLVKRIIIFTIINALKNAKQELSTLLMIRLRSKNVVNVKLKIVINALKLQIV